MKNIFKICLIIILTILVFGCKKTDSVGNTDVIDIQILATSDMHGKFYPWDYSKNISDEKGSLAQVATIAKEKRNANTLIVDAGDVIQDNNAEAFFADDIHPMIFGMNLVGYDYCTTGNHEYNFGMDILKKIFSKHKAKVLVNNLYDKSGKLVYAPYDVTEKSGVKIGVIGTVTRNIKIWDKVNLKEYDVKDSVSETKKCIDELKDKVDVIILLAHMGLENELKTSGTGVRDIANACPELDLIVASHDHKAIGAETINGVLIVENKNYAETVSEIHLKVKKDNNKYIVFEKNSKSLLTKDYKPDADYMQKLSPYHETGLRISNEVIGELKGGDLVEPDEIKGIPRALIEPTPLLYLINKTQEHYAGTKISAATYNKLGCNMYAGPIRRCDISNIYPYKNTLYKIEFTGKQLKKYLEYNARFYNQYKEGDLTVSFNKNIRMYAYLMFDGICYDIDISKPEGSRINNLTYDDEHKTIINDDDKIEVAINDYIANSIILDKGIVYEENDMPKLIKSDIRPDLGIIGSMIADYIYNVKGGVITNECKNNWKIIGNNWNKELHEKAKKQINEGIIKITDSDDKRTPNVVSITVKDLK